jgi:hypothetical protein
MVLEYHNMNPIYSIDFVKNSIILMRGEKDGERISH